MKIKELLESTSVEHHLQSKGIKVHKVEKLENGHTHVIIDTGPADKKSTINILRASQQSMHRAGFSNTNHKVSSVSGEHYTPPDTKNQKPFGGMDGGSNKGGVQWSGD